MLKDALFWAVPGAALILSSTKAASEPGFFRRRVVAAIGLTALLEFYLNTATLDLISNGMISSLNFPAFCAASARCCYIAA